MILQLSSYLFRAKSEDEQNIYALCTAFQDNERMKTLVGRGGQSLSTGIRIVIFYSYFMVKKLGGIFTSKNKSTFLLFYQKSEYYFSFQDILRYLYLAFFVVGFQRIRKVYQREQIIRQTRALKIKQMADEDYLYVWFLAQKKEHKSLAGLVEAKDYILEQSKRRNLPIYMETTEERLLPIYQRMGFDFYDYQNDAEVGLKVWFARCDTML